VFWAGRTFRPAIWNISPSANLPKFSLYCPQKDRPSMGLRVSPRLGLLMFFLGKATFLRTIDGASLFSFQSWSLPFHSLILFLCTVEGNRKKKLQKWGRWRVVLSQWIVCTLWDPIGEWKTVGQATSLGAIHYLHLKMKPCNLFFNSGDKKGKDWQSQKPSQFTKSCYCTAMNFWEVTKFISYYPS
jgi:hypothetical protein